MIFPLLSVSYLHLNEPPFLSHQNIVVSESRCALRSFIVAERLKLRQLVPHVEGVQQENIMMLQCNYWRWRRRKPTRSNTHFF